MREATTYRLALEGAVLWTSSITRPEITEATMRQSPELDIKHVDAPWPRYWQRLTGGIRLRPAAGYSRDRRRLSVHVRSDRRFRA